VAEFDMVGSYTIAETPLDPVKKGLRSLGIRTVAGGTARTYATGNADGELRVGYRLYAHGILPSAWTFIHEATDATTQEPEDYFTVLGADWLCPGECDFGASLGRLVSPGNPLRLLLTNDGYWLEATTCDDGDDSTSPDVCRGGTCVGRAP